MERDIYEELKCYLVLNHLEKLTLLDDAKDFISENRVVEYVSDVVDILFSEGVSKIPTTHSQAKEDDNEEGLSENFPVWLGEEKLNANSFQSTLMSFIKAKGYEDKNSDLYNKISMDRRLFSKISSERYMGVPEKATVFKLIIGLELSLEEAESFLKSSGYCFNCYRKSDMIIKFCVSKKIFNPHKIDNLLVEFGEKALFSEK